VTSRQVQGQQPVAYTYDAGGNLTKAATTGAAIDRTYDVRNLPLTALRSNGVIGSYTYDALGHLAGISEQKGPTSLINRALNYDGAGRLVSHSAEAGQALVTASAIGTFDAANRIQANGGTTYTHDADGNRTTEVSAAGTVTYTWDARGRLQRVVSPGGITTAFLYDYDGNMIQKRVTSGGGDTIERYVLDDLTNVVSQEKVGAGSASLLTGRGLDQHWAVVSGGSGVFPLADHIGSTVALTDAAGTLTGRAFYEPFGKTSTTGGTYPFEFTGRNRVSTDLYYFRARYYDSTSSRFVSEDPAGFFGKANQYAYADNRPTVLTDPTGLKTYDCTAPLHAAPWAYGAPLLYHEYLCVVGADGKETCVGQDREGNGFWSPGKPSNDTKAGGDCKEVEPDNSCIEQCILTEGAAPRPRYGIGPQGTDCQEWADDTLSKCRKQCKPKK